jgi:peptidoglycan/LPS O-acetylase OafA/YrhL
VKNRWQIVAFIAELVVIAVFAVDLGPEWPRDGLPGIRVLAVIAAAVFAGATYIHWETARTRVPATHAAAALGLLGGALLAASVFSHGLDVIFRNTLMASIGVSAIVLSYVLGQLSMFAQDTP